MLNAVSKHQQILAPLPSLGSTGVIYGIHKSKTQAVRFTIRLMPQGFCLDCSQKGCFAPGPCTAGTTAAALQLFQVCVINVTCIDKQQQPIPAAKFGQQCTTNTIFKRNFCDLRSKPLYQLCTQTTVNIQCVVDEQRAAQLQ